MHVPEDTLGHRAWFTEKAADPVLAHGLTFGASGQVCSQREQCRKVVNLISGLKKDARTPKLPFWATRFYTLCSVARVSVEVGTCCIG